MKAAGQGTTNHTGWNVN